MQKNQKNPKENLGKNNPLKRDHEEKNSHYVEDLPKEVNHYENICGSHYGDLPIKNHRKTLEEHCLETMEKQEQNIPMMYPENLLAGVRESLHYILPEIQRSEGLQTETKESLKSLFFVVNYYFYLLSKSIVYEKEFENIVYSIGEYIARFGSSKVSFKSLDSEAVKNLLKDQIFFPKDDAVSIFYQHTDNKNIFRELFFKGMQIGFGDNETDALVHLAKRTEKRTPLERIFLHNVAHWIHKMMNIAKTLCCARNIDRAYGWDHNIVHGDCDYPFYVRTEKHHPLGVVTHAKTPLHTKIVNDTLDVHVSSIDLQGKKGIPVSLENIDGSLSALPVDIRKIDKNITLPVSATLETINPKIKPLPVRVEDVKSNCTIGVKNTQKPFMVANSPCYPLYVNINDVNANAQGSIPITIKDIDPKARPMKAILDGLGSNMPKIPVSASLDGVGANLGKIPVEIQGIAEGLDASAKIPVKIDEPIYVTMKQDAVDVNIKSVNGCTTTGACHQNPKGGFVKL